MIRALVVGRSRGALLEYVCACALGVRYDHVLVVGEMGVHFPDTIDHWVSFHADLFDSWASRRAKNGLAPAKRYWGCEHRGRRAPTQCRPVDYVKCSGGSSGFVATQVALGRLGAARVVLAGVPMQAEAGRYNASGTWDEADVYWQTWLDYADGLRGRVRSMSGCTRELLGEPTREWLLC